MVRQLAGAVTLGLAILAVPLISATAAAGGAARPQSTPSFVALAKVGASGKFDEAYQVEGPGNGIVEIAQEELQQPFNAGTGQWSFVYQTPTGTSSQWIEKGSSSWDCWHQSGVTTWTCSGPGHFQQSNGFILSVEPYIPGLVLDEMSQLQQSSKIKPDPVKSIGFYSSKSTRFGPLRCERVDAMGYGRVTSCLDRHGVLVTQQGGSYWSKITLLKYRSGIPGSAFRLMGANTSPGSSFVVPPF
jgi:hypothetical protein